MPANLLRFQRLIIGTLFLCASAAAQGPVRLSPYEQTARGVAPWFANQSIDGVDSIALAVWGTNTPIGGREVAEAIYGQILVAGKPVGRPRRMTPPEARPFLVCNVVVVGRRFALLWNDARGDTSIMVQLVDRTGDLEGEPRVFSEGVVMRQGEITITPFGFPEGGRLLGWIDGRSAIRRTIVRRIEADGTFDTPETVIGREFFGYRRYNTLPGTTFICAGDSTAMVDPAGIVHTPFVSTIRFQLAHVITPDSTLLLLRDTSIIYYGDPLSTVETRRVAVTNLRGVPDKYRAVSLPIDDTVTVILASSDGQQARFRMCKIIGGIAGPDSLVHTTNYKPIVAPYSIWSEWTIEGLERTQPCGNGGLFTIRVVHEFYTSSIGYRVQPGTGYFLLSDSGRFLPDRAIGCQPSILYSIIRTNVDITDSSSVRIVVNGITSKAAVGTYPWVHNRMQHRPGVYTSGDVLHVSWQNDTINSGVSLGRWRTHGGDSVIPTGAVSSSFRNLPLSNTTIGLLLETLLDNGTFYGDPQWIARYAIATPQQGKLIEIGREKSNHNNYGAYAHHVGSTCDPNTRLSIAVVALASYSNASWTRIFHYIGPDGKLVRRIFEEGVPLSTIESRVEFVPVVDTTTLWIQGTIARRRTGQIWGDTIILPPTPFPARYQRLYGPHFLRWYPTDSTGRELTFQRFSIDGTLLDSIQFRAETSMRDVTVVPDPRDSSVLVLYRTTGLRVLGFHPALNTIDIDTLLVDSRSAEMPSATVRGDSLFVVWQDTGEGGGMDIYGLRLLLPRGGKPAAVETDHGSARDARGSQAASGVDGLSVRPNPASESVELGYRLVRSGHVAVDIVDDRGKLVRRGEEREENAGMHHRTVPIAALPPGVYSLVLRGDGWSEGARVVVVR